MCLADTMRVFRGLVIDFPTLWDINERLFGALVRTRSASLAVLFSELAIDSYHRLQCDRQSNDCHSNWVMTYAFTNQPITKY